MKCKKLISMLLALVMMMALVVPAGAAKPAKNKGNTPAAQAIPVDKIEGNDPRKPIVESGAKIDTAGYPAIYIKQANDIAIIVPSEDTRTDADIIAEAAASDNSLNKQDKGTTTVIHGDGSVWLHKNKTTLVTVKDGILTVVGPISHIDFGGGKPAPEFPTEPEDPGTTSTTVTFTKYVDEFGTTTDEKFTFKVYDSSDNMLDVTISNTGNDYSFTVEPKLEAGTYTIKEVLTDEQAGRFVDGKTLTFTVNDAGVAAFENDDNSFINETKTVVKFTKTVDGKTPTEDFQFDIYQGGVLKAENAFTASADYGTYTATITPKLADGEYTIVEVLTDEQKGQYVDGKTLSFSVENGVAAFTTSTIDNEQLGFIDVTNPTVNQKHITQYHETEYLWYGKDIDGSTVVSVTGDGAFNNGFTYMTVSKAELTEAGSLTFQIGYKDGKKGIIPCPAMRKTGNVPTYTIAIKNIDGVDKLVLTSDLSAFTGETFATNKELPKNWNAGHHVSDQMILNLPEGDAFIFAFHGQTKEGDGAPYETNQIKGCKFLRDDVTYDDVSTQCIFTVTVTDSQGSEVDNYKSGLLPGTYTVTVTATFGEETLTWEENGVVVAPGGTTEVAFEAKTVSEIVKTIECSCGEDLTPVEP